MHVQIVVTVGETEDSPDGSTMTAKFDTNNLNTSAQEWHELFATMLRGALAMRDYGFAERALRQYGKE